MQKVIWSAVSAAVITLALAAPAYAGVTKSVHWVCQVPEDGGGYTEVVFVSAPEAARHGITQANLHAGQTFATQFGEICTVQ